MNARFSAGATALYWFFVSRYRDQRATSARATFNLLPVVLTRRRLLAVGRARTPHSI
jgi:hypothetical protein